MFGFGAIPTRTEEEEKQAVKTLRERLSDGSQPVEEQLRKGGEAGLQQGLDDNTLDRWLSAEDYDIDKAEKRIRSHAEWREAEFPAGRVLESEIAEELATKKVFLQGLDKGGRRILFLKVSRHSRSLRDLKQTMRLLCYALDKAIGLADKEKNPEGFISGIFDLRGLTMDSIDSSALKGVFEMLQAHYPQRLGTLWMYESPGIFWALWKAVSPFIDTCTRKKVVFVSESTAAKDMEDEIDAEVLPKELGGKAELVPIQDFADGMSMVAEGAVANGGQTSTADNGVQTDLQSPVGSTKGSGPLAAGAIMGP